VVIYNTAAAAFTARFKSRPHFRQEIYSPICRERNSIPTDNNAVQRESRSDRIRSFFFKFTSRIERMGSRCVTPDRRSRTRPLHVGNGIGERFRYVLGDAIQPKFRNPTKTIRRSRGFRRR